jgi:carbamoyltransferase|tara:strand:- start:118 stop:2052 length:1935 start_codon:yes stop_codon:yes gene_type:complete
MSQWILGIARGHNAGACLLKDGEIVWNLEEERLTRVKYDGAPLATINLVKEFTDHLDYMVICHTTRMDQHKFLMDYCGNDPYYGLARKLGLLPDHDKFGERPPCVIDMGHIHHRLHAASAFYNSGFDEAVGVVVDGAGSWTKFGAEERFLEDYWETETIFNCGYPSKFDTIYKHIGTKFASPLCYYQRFDNGFWDGYGMVESYESPDCDNCELVATPGAGIVKTYEAITEYCGFPSIEAGKTMGLFPYGKEVDYLPRFWKDEGMAPVQLSDRNTFTPMYPNGALFNAHLIKEVEFCDKEEGQQLYDLQNRADAAYKVQKESQRQVLALIRKAVEMTGHKNVTLSGGYGLNCVANYYYLDQLKDEGINLYVEPISNDSGTALGGAMLWHHRINDDLRRHKKITNLYMGPERNYTDKEIEVVIEKYNATVTDATHKDVVDLILNKNIVALFQGRSEAGPRALGNRSFLYDPRDPDGKDHVNKVKRREFFRPFAGSILKEHVHEWFDLRGMEETPFMMYAVNCKEGVEEKIPAIIHVDGTCRIQTVTEEQNKNYYEIIQEFFKQTGCPIIFNTSFNLGGEPLVETLDDAIRTIRHSAVDYLYLPEYGKLVTVKEFVPTDLPIKEKAVRDRLEKLGRPLDGGVSEDEW